LFVSGAKVQASYGWFGCSSALAQGLRVNISAQPTIESPDAGEMRWYILKVQFNREDTIREALEKRIRLSELKNMFGEILVPTEDVVEFTRAGKRRVMKRKLYPGYLVVHMIINDDTWFLVRETTGVGDFTGSGGKPTAMTDSDVERILKMAYPDADDEQVPKTTIPFRSGERIRVKEGNFQSLEGDVDRIDEANGRVTVIISIFGRSTPVELDHWQIESL
jgi:transcription termination/antitermination protein NusG